MAKSLNIRLSQPQFDFHASKSKSTALVAGYGSGKTEVATVDMILSMFSNPGADMLYVAPTYPLIFDIFYPKIETLLEKMCVNYRINYSKNNVHIEGCGVIRCRTMEHPHRLIGFEVLHAYLDEIDVLPEEKALEVWRKVKARCRQKVKGVLNQVKLTTTPEGFKFCYEHFKNNPLPGSKLIHCSTYSNAHNLPPDYIDDLKANYPSQLIEAYLMGNFVNLTSGTVYTAFNRKLNDAPYVNITDGDVLHIGMDFNIRHMSAIIHVIRNGFPVAVSEIIDVLDTPSMITTIKELYPYHNVIIYPDASGEHGSTHDASVSDLRLLRIAGFSVKAERANPRIKDRVLAVNAMFCNAVGDRRYLVNVNNCQKYVNNLEQQAYTNEGLPDKSNNTDHTNDAAGYFINKVYGIKKRSAGTRRSRAA